MVGFIMDIDYPHTMSSRADRLNILQHMSDHKRGTPLADHLRVYDPIARVTLQEVLTRVAAPTSLDVDEHYARISNFHVTVCNGFCEERQRLVDLSVTLVADNALVRGSADSSDDMKMERQSLYLEVVVLPLQ